MAYMRSTVAYGLFWVNLILTSFLLYFSIAAYNFGSDSYNYHSYHLRGTKEKLLENNANYFLEKETPKELRNLSSSKDVLIVLYIDIVAILFVLILMSSFCVSGNECCTPNQTTNENFAIGSCYGTCICCGECRGGGGDCKCEGSGDAGIAILIIIVILLVFVIVYFAVKACGKHISRMFSAAALFLCYLGMFAMGLYTGKGTYYYLIAVFSVVGAICNFLAILLPNLTSCAILRYNMTNVQIASPTIVQPATVQLIQQPYVQPATPDINQNVIQAPPAQPMNTVYTNPSPGYDNNTYGNIYEAPPVQQPNNYNQINQVNYQYPAQQ